MLEKLELVDGSGFFDVNTVHPGSVRCAPRSLGIFSRVVLPGVSELVCGVGVGFDLRGRTGRESREGYAIVGPRAPACGAEDHGCALVIVGRRGARARAYITGTAAAWPRGSPRRGPVPLTRQC